jgi:hypothetical protein
MCDVVAASKPCMWLPGSFPLCTSEDALCCASVLPIAAPVLFILFLLDSGLTLDPGSKSTTHSSQHFRLLSAAYCSLRNKLSDHLVLRLNHIRYCMPCWWRKKSWRGSEESHEDAQGNWSHATQEKKDAGEHVIVALLQRQGSPFTSVEQELHCWAECDDTGL